MQLLYIIDTKKPFNGRIVTTMKKPINEDRLDMQPLHYTDETFQERNEKEGGGLIAIPWEELEEKYYNPYLNSLQKPFVEITAERYDEMLGVLPPKRWTTHKGVNYFFISEAHISTVHACFVKYKGKYYEALRDITLSDNEIANSFKKDI